MLNVLILHGNLTKDPVLRVTPKGKSVCNFSIANNRQYHNEAGDLQQETVFVEVTAWGKTAEVIEKHFIKGMPMLAKGRLTMDQYIEKGTDKNRTVHKMELESFDFVSRKADGSTDPVEEHSGVAASREG